VWLDSLDSKNKIAECSISNTGSWDVFITFTAKVLLPVSGNHDVYLRFRGTGSDKLFMLQWLTFVGKTSPASSVGESKSGEVPGKFSLEQNFPNPFNPSTTVSYRLSAVSHVTLRIFDMLGREIVTLVNNEQAAGQYTAQWDAKNKNGEDLSSGVYFYQLRAGEFVSTNKMIFMK
jgi:xylan 1,4-beta-xylosidase